MGANASTIADFLTQQFHKLDKDRKRGYLVCVVLCVSSARAINWRGAAAAVAVAHARARSKKLLPHNHHNNPDNQKRI
jgi:hypothetical protein